MTTRRRPRRLPPRSPRFTGDNARENVALVAVSASRRSPRRHPRPDRPGLAAAQGGDVVPIPGTKRVSHLEENVGALGVTLTADDLAELDDLLPEGDRYPDMSWVERNTPTPAR